MKHIYINLQAILLLLSAVAFNIASALQFGFTGWLWIFAVTCFLLAFMVEVSPKPPQK